MAIPGDEIPRSIEIVVIKGFDIPNGVSLRLNCCGQIQCTSPKLGKGLANTWDEVFHFNHCVPASFTVDSYSGDQKLATGYIHLPSLRRGTNWVGWVPLMPGSSRVLITYCLMRLLLEDNTRPIGDVQPSTTAGDPAAFANVEGQFFEDD